MNVRVSTLNLGSGNDTVNLAWLQLSYVLTINAGAGNTVVTQSGQDSGSGHLIFNGGSGADTLKFTFPPSGSSDVFNGGTGENTLDMYAARGLYMLQTTATDLSWTHRLTVNVARLSIGAADEGGADPLISSVTTPTVQFSQGFNIEAINIIGSATNSGAVEFSGTSASTVGTINCDTGGTIQVDSGASLTIQNSSTIGSLVGGGTTDLANSTALTINGTQDSTFSGVIGGSGSMIKAGATTFTLSGANTYSGGTTINGGIFSISADNNLGGGTVAVAIGAGTLRATGTFSTSRTVTSQMPPAPLKLLEQMCSLWPGRSPALAA